MTKTIETKKLLLQGFFLQSSLKNLKLKYVFYSFVQLSFKA